MEGRAVRKWRGSRLVKEGEAIESPPKQRALSPKQDAFHENH